jgi:hypothetical protein
VLLEAGAVLLFLCDLWVVEEPDFLCEDECLEAELEEEAGAAVDDWSWANTEPERATPATSREAIASLRIMIMSLEIF